jgi:hypothetical protein
MEAPTAEAATVFWLRLYGVLHEVRRRHEPEPSPVIEQGAESEVEPDLRDERTRRQDEHYTEQAELQDEYYGALAADVLVACESLRDAFTPDELLAIQWKRDDEAHAELDGYELKDQNGVLNEYRDKTLIGRVRHERVHAAVGAMRNGRDDTSVAIELARRAESHIDKLIAALARFQ